METVWYALVLSEEMNTNYHQMYDISAFVLYSF